MKHYLVGDTAYPETNDPAAEYGKPVIVIDPEDREAVERLVETMVRFEGPGPATFADRIQLALREFANPTPPKPDEPMGLGAVVEDEGGVRYSRVSGDDDSPWAKSPVETWQIECFAWHEVTAVRVLSEGVPA